MSDKKLHEIVVISGKGGTGKTSIVSALAAVGPDKILADCDVDAADLHLILEPEVLETHEFWSGEHGHIEPDLCTQCGLCLEHCRYGAIAKSDSGAYQVISENCEGCGVCAYVCPVQAATMQPRMCGHWFHSKTRFGEMIHAKLGIGEENSGKLVTTVRRASGDLAKEKNIDFVLVDGSPGVGCPVIASLTNASMAVLVVEPTISAIHDMQRVHKLTRHFKIPALAIINKADINPELVQEMQDYCRTEEMPVLGVLPYDQKVTQAQIKGQSMTEYDPDGLGRTIREIWEKIEQHLKE